MKRRISSVVTGALLVGAMVIALAPPAWAPRAWGVPSLIAPCSDGWTFTGVLTITDFDSKVELLASGTIEGACRAPGDTDTRAMNTTFTVTATVLDASCENISIALANISDEKGNTIDMRDEVVPLENPTNDPRLRKLMCQFAGRWRSVMYLLRPQKLVADLDRILLVLDSLEE